MVSERASMLRYAYIACLVSSCIKIILRKYQYSAMQKCLNNIRLQNIINGLCTLVLNVDKYGIYTYGLQY